MGPTTPPPAIHSPSPDSPLRDVMALSCASGSHAHALELKPDGSYVVYSYPNEKGQPDLVLDGKCHLDDNSEQVVDSDRKVLPVPKRKGT